MYIKDFAIDSQVPLGYFKFYNLSSLLPPTKVSVILPKAKVSIALG